MHGEDVIIMKNKNWTDNFLRDFATIQVPYHFLCTHKRLAIKGFGINERCEFSDGVISYNKGRRITQNGNLIKDGDTLFLPLVQKENQYFAYSKKGDARFWNINTDSKKANIYRVTPNSNEFIKEENISNGKIMLKINSGEGLLIELI